MYFIIHTQSPLSFFRAEDKFTGNFVFWKFQQNHYIHFEMFAENWFAILVNPIHPNPSMFEIGSGIWRNQK